MRLSYYARLSHSPAAQVLQMQMQAVDVPGKSARPFQQRRRIKRPASQRRTRRALRGAAHAEVVSLLRP